MRRVGRDETAFVHRDADYNLAMMALDRPGRGRRAHRLDPGALGGDGPFAAGVYVNYLGGRGGGWSGRPTAPRYERLVALKNQYDPANLFRLNQNIKPAV